MWLLITNGSHEVTLFLLKILDIQPMDDDFFGGDAPVYTSSSQNYVPPAAHSYENDDFDFGDTQYQSQPVVGQSAYFSNDQTGSQSNIDFGAGDQQTVRLIQEEEERIQKLLREKSKQQYEQKNHKREEGRKQLEDFLSKKQKETQIRRQQNKTREELKLKQIKKLSEEAGWKKVSANVGLKQGESKAKKDTNRMREAILNKRGDESQS